MPGKRKRVLVYRIGSLGDTIISLPGFNKVLETFPDAEIILLANRPLVSKAPGVAAVLDNGLFYHRVLTYPTGTRSLSVLFALWREISALRIDVVVNLTTTRIGRTLFRTKLAVLRDRLFFLTAGVRTLIGFPAQRADYELMPDAATGGVEWEAFRIVRRLGKLGEIRLNDSRYWDMRFTATERNEAASALATLDKHQPILAICAGTKMSSKDWEQHNWSALIAELSIALPGWQLIAVGAPDEYDRSEQCLAYWGGRALNLCGKTSPRVSGVILEKAGLFVGHDSGPMHLAAAVGTPCVAIFAARALQGHWYPRRGPHKIIYREVPCAGCGLEVCTIMNKVCILSVPVSEVKNAVLELAGRERGAITT